MISDTKSRNLRKTWFERAIFISWYCSIRDCKFCYMSTIKAEPKKSRRRTEGVYAEALISKICGWKIEFISGGIDCYPIEKIAEISKIVYQITGEKQWLNIGPLNKDQIKAFGDSIEGVCGSYECINPKIRKNVCPSKPAAPIEKTLTNAKELGLKNAITIIIGLGETLDDIPHLIEFVKKYELDRITFYALNPHEGTCFTKGPDSDYYAEWIKQTRNAFPNLNIIAGSWVNRLDELSSLLNAGATAFTKFPSIKLFNSKYAKQIEDEIKLAGLNFEGTMTQVPTEAKIKYELEKCNLDLPQEKKDLILKYAFRLLKRMKSN